MARYTGPTCRFSRRAKQDLGLKSVAAVYDKKCKSEVAPGQHGSRRPRSSTYGLMLQEKQKLRRIYGLLERQFKRFYSIAAKQKGATGENLMRILESRLDNVVYRMGFAATRSEARQLVSHASVLVNGKTVNIPSYLVKPGDSIEIRERAKKQLRIAAALEMAAQQTLPEHFSVDAKQMSGTFNEYPDAEALHLSDINLNLVIEFYSR